MTGRMRQEEDKYHFCQLICSRVKLTDEKLAALNNTGKFVSLRHSKSTHQAQRHLTVHAAVHNLVNLGRNLVSGSHYRLFGQRTFASWENAAAVQKPSIREVT